MQKKNFILSTDSYKYSMPFQYPEKSEYVYSYIESRGGDWDQTVFFGLQAYIIDYLSNPITQEDIDEAEEMVTAHGEPFYREGWQYILDTYDGYLPITIRAVPEGSVIKNKNILVDIVNTDPKCWWLTTFVETSLLRGIWYPTTVATNSFESKKIIMQALEKSGDPSTYAFKLHDFGARGVSSAESAALGGMAHLVNFMGTDTIEAVRSARYYYNCPMAGFSIPAAEHSTITSWGRENEVEAYRNMLKRFAAPGSIVAVVSDSYDIYNACENLWGGALKQEVIDSGATVVVRPDSGYPPEVVLNCLRILDSKFGSTVNEKGYKVLNNVRIIQGDGIDHETIQLILNFALRNGYSADNIAFGQGGALLQIVNRDTLKFAMKCSSIVVDGQDRDVYKDPVTDSGKKSKKGRLELVVRDGKIQTVRKEDLRPNEESLMNIVFDNGNLRRVENFVEIRARAHKYFE